MILCTKGQVTMAVLEVCKAFLVIVICRIYKNTQKLQPRPFYAGFRTGSGHIGDQANVILIITKITKMIIL